ncbi:hypothetical protein [Gordonia cholesterolivorans]|uniref:hypothetical protein n=1 Tax=Gordonia cholesterolivorans TaxID=559625 RepID=UPI0031F8BC93
MQTTESLLSQGTSTESPTFNVGVEAVARFVVLGTTVYVRSMYSVTVVVAVDEDGEPHAVSAVTSRTGVAAKTIARVNPVRRRSVEFESMTGSLHASRTRRIRLGGGEICGALSPGTGTAGARG